VTFIEKCLRPCGDILKLGDDPLVVLFGEKIFHHGKQRALLAALELA